MATYFQGDVAYAASVASESFNDGTWTIFCIFKTPATVDDGMIMCLNRGHTITGRQQGLGIDNGKWALGNDQGSMTWSASSIDVAPNTWYRLIVTHESGNTLRGRINAYGSTISYNHLTTTATNTHVNIGANTNSSAAQSPCEGYYAQVGFWDSVLSRADQEDLLDARMRPDEISTSPTEYWSLIDDLNSDNSGTNFTLIGTVEYDKQDPDLYLPKIISSSALTITNADATATYTVGTGKNRVLVAVITHEQAASGRYNTGVDFGTTAMTNIVQATHYVTGDGAFAEIWVLLEDDIPTGAQTLSVTTTHVDEQHCHIYTLGNVAQEGFITDTDGDVIDNSLSCSIFTQKNAITIAGAISTSISADYGTWGNSFIEDHESEPHGTFSAAYARKTARSPSENTSLGFGAGSATIEHCMAMASFKGFEEELPIFHEATASYQNTITNDVDISYPSTVNDKDMLILKVSKDGTTDLLDIAGWQEIGDQSGGSNHRSKWYFKEADGTETGTFNVEINGADLETWVWCIWRFSNVEPKLLLKPHIEHTSGSSTTPNPPLSDEIMGARPFAVLATASCDGGKTFSAYPTGYSSTGNEDTGSTTMGWAVENFYKDTQENPDSFTISGTDEWHASTIVLFGKRKPKVTSGDYWTGNFTSISQTYKHTGGALLLVGQGESTGGAPTLSGVTFDGVSPDETLIDKVANFSANPGGAAYAYVWYNMQARSATLSVTSSSQFYGGIRAYSIEHADIATPIFSSAQVNETSGVTTESNSLTTLPSDSLVIDFIGVDSPDESANLDEGDTQTEIGNPAFGSSYLTYASSYKRGSGTVTMEWDWLASQENTHLLFAFQPQQERVAKLYIRSSFSFPSLTDVNGEAYNDTGGRSLEDSAGNTTNLTFTLNNSLATLNCSSYTGPPKHGIYAEIIKASCSYEASGTYSNLFTISTTGNEEVTSIKVWGASNASDGNRKGEYLHNGVTLEHSARDYGDAAPVVFTDIGTMPVTVQSRTKSGATYHYPNYVEITFKEGEGGGSTVQTVIYNRQNQEV